MANKARKAEHTGPKNSNRKGGYWGKRVDAKQESNRLRREIDKVETMRPCAIDNPGPLGELGPAGQDPLKRG